MGDTVKLLATVKETLNQIEVHGRNNLDMLLGCINAVNDCIVKLTEAESTQEAGEVNGG